MNKNSVTWCVKNEEEKWNRSEDA